MVITYFVVCLQRTTPVILRDGNGAIYPVAKDCCLDGIRDPVWLDMAPLCSLSMAMQSLPSIFGPSSRLYLAIIALALEVCMTLRVSKDSLHCKHYCKPVLL